MSSNYTWGDAFKDFARGVFLAFQYENAKEKVEMDLKYLDEADTDQEALIRLEGLMYTTYLTDDMAWEILRFSLEQLGRTDNQARMLLGHASRIRLQYKN